MIIPIELKFKADKKTRSAFRTDKIIKSHDVNSVEFHISIDGVNFTGNYTAKILSLFHSSKSQVNTDCEIVKGKIIYKPDTNLISSREDVTNYVYVYNNNQSLDVCAFTYTVDLSKIDETSLKVKEVYDQSYSDLLADFEQALTDYKDTLPQASDLRAEIDVILNQFGVDSQAKLNQYDADAQQAIADNQTAFNLAETGRQEDFDTSQSERQKQFDDAQSARQESYEQTQSLINEAEESRVQAEAQRKSAESSRLIAESNRVSAEEQRKIDHANRSAELAGKANKQQEDWITPTLLNGWTDFGGVYESVGYMKDEFGFVHIKGMVKDGSVGKILFTLPEGYRPLKHQYHPCFSLDILRTLTIRGNGDIFIPAAASNVWLALNGISFKAEA